MKLIGLSLSACVRDMAKYGIKKEDVSLIISGTHIVTLGDFKRVIEVYNRSFWLDFPQAAKLAVDLFIDGKVYQPRVEGKEAPSLSNYLHCPWVEV